jgi:hypothetical protein
MFQKNAIAVFITLAAGLLTTQAHAVQRAHVSALAGTDANTATGCTVPAPCRTFQAAISVVDTNGEVVALDSGGYGAVNITKSISLTAPTGVYAGISVFPGSDGVTMATPNIYVTLRGITINSQGGNNGINVSAPSTLSVENAVITNFTGTNRAGIRVSAAARVNVSDSLLRNNEFGIYFRAGTASVIRTTLLGYGDTGVYAGDGVGSTTVSITDCTITSYQYGIRAVATTNNVDVILSQNKVVVNRVAVSTSFNFNAVDSFVTVVSLGNNTFYPDNATPSNRFFVVPLR